MIGGDAGVAWLHEHRRGLWPSPSVGCCQAIGVRERVPHRVRHVDHAAAVLRVGVQPRPARAFGADAAVLRPLPLEELLAGVVGARQDHGLSSALLCLVIQADKEEGVEASKGQGHFRILEEGRVVVPQHLGATADVAQRAGGNVPPVNLFRCPLHGLLGRPDGDVPVHVQLGPEIGHVAVPVADVVEGLARVPALQDSHLAGAGRVKAPERVVEDGGQVRPVDQVGQGCVHPEILAAFGAADPVARRLDQGLRNRLSDDHVAVGIEPPLFVIGELTKSRALFHGPEPPCRHHF